MKARPDIFADICAALPELDVQGDIIQYLLHKKTEQTLTVDFSNEEVLAYWWDDYFSTAEVVSALALFHHYCSGSEDAAAQYAPLTRAVKETLVRACTYFEQGQVEGMWGSHIDTIRVTHAYVLIRRMIPQRLHGLNEPLIVPEIHTTFKALRWMCDPKQIFSDGSFLHTMFLTIFYASALIEVYRSWEPCRDSIDKIYDDVVWFSPVRTTPERSKRLAAELVNTELEERLASAKAESERLSRSLVTLRRIRGKIVATGLLFIIGLTLFLIVGNTAKLFTTSFRMLRASDFWQYTALGFVLLSAALTLIWKWDTLFVDDDN